MQAWELVVEAHEEVRIFFHNMRKRWKTLENNLMLAVHFHSFNHDLGNFMKWNWRRCAPVGLSWHILALVVRGKTPGISRIYSTQGGSWFWGWLHWWGMCSTGVKSRTVTSSSGSGKKQEVSSSVLRIPRKALQPVAMRRRGNLPLEEATSMGSASGTLAWPTFSNFLNLFWRCQGNVSSLMLSTEAANLRAPGMFQQNLNFQPS